MSRSDRAQDAQDMAASIRKAILTLTADLEPEDALNIAKSILDAVNVRACIWEPDDIDTVLDERHYEADITDQEREDIKAKVLDSYGWRTVLQEPREDDWDTINGEIWEAARSLGIDLNRNDSI